MPAVPRNPSLKELRSFCVAARSRTFRQAAETLFVTASAISHQIKSLEAELGTRLFERGPGDLTLTEAGESLYADLQPAIRHLDSVVSRHRIATPRRRLSISVQPFFGSELFVPRLPEFLASHPEIDIVVDTSDEAAEKHPATADVSIRVFKSPPKQLSATALFPLRLVPASTRQFRDTMQLKGHRIVSDFPIIVHATRPRAWQKWQRSADVELPRDPPSVHLDSMIAVARAAERGIGAALVPVQLSESWFASGSLVRLFSHELETPDSYYIVCQPEVADNADVVALRDWAVETFGTLR